MVGHSNAEGKLKGLGTRPVEIHDPVPKTLHEQFGAFIRSLERQNSELVTPKASNDIRTSEGESHDVRDL